MAKIEVLSRNDGTKYIIQLLDGNSKLQQERRDVTGGTVQFNYIPAGDMKFRVIEDLNGNGRWDTGNVVERRQPERAELYANADGQDTFVARTNWEFEITIDMNKLFAPVTMESLSRMLEDRELQRLRREGGEAPQGGDPSSAAPPMRVRAWASEAAARSTPTVSDKPQAYDAPPSHPDRGRAAALRRRSLGAAYVRRHGRLRHVHRPAQAGRGDPPVWNRCNAGLTWRYYGPQRFVGGFGLDLEYLQQGFSYAPYASTIEDKKDYRYYTRRYNSLVLPVVWAPHFYIRHRVRIFLEAMATFSYHFGSTCENELTGTSGKYAFRVTRDNRWGYGLAGGGGFAVLAGRFEVQARVRYYFGFLGHRAQPQQVRRQHLRRPRESVLLHPAPLARR